MFTNAVSIGKAIFVDNQNTMICQKKTGALFCFVRVFIFAFVIPNAERSFKRDATKIPEFGIILSYTEVPNLYLTVT